jgi:hypothetical protein
VRMMPGVLVGLSIARLLTGLARFVQHPSREQVYGPHLAPALFMLLTVIHYWWAEFNLAQIHTWSSRTSCCSSSTSCGLRFSQWEENRGDRLPLFG